MSEFLSVPEGWILRKFGEVAQLTKGVTYTSDQYCDQGKGAAFLTIKSVAKNGGYKPEGIKYYSGPISSKQKLAVGDLLIANTDLTRAGDIVGCPVIVPKLPQDEITMSMDLSKVEVNVDLIDKRYLAYALMLDGARSFMKDNASGSTVLHLRTSQVPMLRLLAPISLDEQRGIAEVLSALDEQIEASDALVDKLTLRRKGFVQEELLSAINASSTVALGSVCSVITSGSRGWAQYYSPEGDLFLRIGNLTRSHPNLRFEDVIRVKPPEGGEGQRTRLEAGDVLISITADLGIIGCVPKNLGSAYINQHIALARITDTDLDPRWVAHALASPFGFDQISKLNDGGAKAGLNLPTIKALRVPKPRLAIQKKLATLLDAADEEIAAEKELAEKLRLQKQGLMRDLLTGAVRVAGAH
ncbi:MULTISPECIES: restriction endonuclease subunit S [Alcaligenes]|uniref:restriction endonuclease subunit S n=1 Tax=Alcaligenes TaxID=507 RepID=UPI002881EA7C|nr:restriction endonuclease subunit S [Alcaligenes sp. AB3]MDT0216766.1 restriction endonuclease subunit S [Alcaligenes sp. AB3]